MASPRILALASAARTSASARPITVTKNAKTTLVSALRRYAGSLKSRAKLPEPTKISRSPKGEAR